MAGVVWTWPLAAGDTDAEAAVGSEIEKLSKGCVVDVVAAAAEAGAGTV